MGRLSFQASPSELLCPHSPASLPDPLNARVPRGRGGGGTGGPKHPWVTRGIGELPGQLWGQRWGSFINVQTAVQQGLLAEGGRHPPQKGLGKNLCSEMA